VESLLLPSSRKESFGQKACARNGDGCPDAGPRIGCTAATCGNLDGAPYQLFVMKNDGYNMKLMSSYGTVNVPKYICRSIGGIGRMLSRPSDARRLL
jgi:hypothetical protein